MLLTRLGRGRSGAGWRSVAWVILCLRLAVPVPWMPAVQNRVQAPIRIPVPSETVLSPPSGPGESMESGTAPSGSAHMGADPAPPGTGSVSAPAEPAAGSPQQASVPLSLVLFVLWAGGALVELGRLVSAHLRFLSWVRRWGQPAEEPELLQLCREMEERLNLRHGPQLILCPGLPSPMLAGVIHPVVLLPEKRPEEMVLHHALLHELVHYRRKDLLRKALALWVQVLHWFNPVLRCMVRQVERDTELACDEAVVRLLPREERRAYGETILAAVEQNRMSGSAAARVRIRKGGEKR